MGRSECPQSIHIQGEIFALDVVTNGLECSKTIGQTEECVSQWMASGVTSGAKVAVSQDLWHDPSSVRVLVTNECSFGWLAGTLTRLGHLRHGRMMCVTGILSI